MEPNTTVDLIKEEIHQIEGIPADQQRLLYHRLNLNDSSTFETLGIKEGDVIHMVSSIR